MSCSMATVIEYTWCPNLEKKLKMPTFLIHLKNSIFYCLRGATGRSAKGHYFKKLKHEAMSLSKVNPDTETDKKFKDQRNKLLSSLY